MQPSFPFTAIVAQERLKTALQLISIDPKIGGLLLSGPRGSAKSTMVRSLASLNHGQSFVTVPLGASEEMVVGSFDLEKALNDAEVAFRPGLLARANGGILYVDEVNLLADNLVDLLLDAAACGFNLVERDGISHQHEAEFSLVGTMNPDEGELRPQLLDRFGLMARVETEFSIEQRQQVVQQRLAYDRDPAGFVNLHREQLGQLQARLEWAREHLCEVVVPASISEQIAQRCAEANVEGFRADIIMHRSSSAYAALCERLEVSSTDLDEVEDLVLDHRRQRSSQNPPSSPAGSSHSSDSSDQGQEGSSIQGSWGAMESVASEIAESRALLASHFEAASKASPGHESGLTGKRKGRFFSPAYTNRPSAGRSKIDWFRTLGLSHDFYKLKQSGKRGCLQYLYPRLRCRELNLVLLDVSASTLGGQGLAQAKGLLRELSRQTYLKRQLLSVITFGNDRVNTLIHPQRAPKDIEVKLNSIRAGGGTPVVKALDYAHNLLKRQRFQQLDCSIFLVTDGRLDPGTKTHTLFTRHSITLVDIESSRVKLGLGRQLANAIAARYLHISELAVV
ncbi:MAG: VWA domain-containing protein [Gammaproteobacteria bacterium]